MSIPKNVEETARVIQLASAMGALAVVETREKDTQQIAYVLISLFPVPDTDTLLAEPLAQIYDINVRKAKDIFENPMNDLEQDCDAVDCE